jgi:hypothetical protein
MVILAALPGIGKALLVTGKLANPGNNSVTVNFLGSELRIAGLVLLYREVIKTQIVCYSSFMNKSFIKRIEASERAFASVPARNPRFFQEPGGIRPLV